MNTIRMATCRHNINILGTTIVNNIPGAFRDVKNFFRK